MLKTSAEVSGRENDIATGKMNKSDVSCLSWYSWRPLPFLLLLVTFSCVLINVSSHYSPDTLHLHEVLTSFTVRGQTTVELFAPLSTIVASSPGSREFLLLASCIAWYLVIATLLKRLEEHKVLTVNNLAARTLICVFMVGLIWNSSSEKPKNLLPLVRSFVHQIFQTVH